MNTDSDAWQPAWRRVFFDAPDDVRLRVFRWAYVLGSAAHLWLADPWRTDDWLLANLLYILGLVLVAWRGAAVGYALCALGAIIPVLFHHDQLTQSVLLALMATAAGWYTARGRVEPLLRSVQWLTVATYLAAGFHKLNADFLDERYSCAVYGAQKVAGYWGVGELQLPGWVSVLTIVAVLAVEFGIAAGLAAGWRWLAWPLAVAFHIPLTLTMAPAFAFVMLAGHAAFVTRADVTYIGERWRGALMLIGPAVVLTVISLALHGSLPEWSMIPKEAMLWWGALVLGWMAWTRIRSHGWPGVRERIRRPAAVGGVVVAIYVASAMSPYTGLQFQHAAAMLSNLRIDGDCWNHVVIPRGARVTDDYVRIDEAYIIREGAIPDYEALLEDHLWGPTLLEYTAENWCKPSVRPIRIEGQFRGEPVVVEDLCDGLGPQIGPAATLGLLRYQKFLKRQCPQACIH